MKKLAMIGCGGIGNYHLSHFLGFKDIVELVGFCDLIPERADSACARAGSGKAYTDFKIMLDETEPDMVFVCVPPTCHGEIEFELIRRGIHFFVEKPMALDPDLVRTIRDGIEEKGLITAVGFQCRYADPIIAPAKRFVADNTIIYVEASRIDSIPHQPWWRNKATSGGQVVEQTIHQFDIIRYLIGEPEEVFSYNARGFVDKSEWEGYDTDDLSVTAIKFKCGALCTLSSGCYAKAGDSFDSKITFSSYKKRMEHRILDNTVIYGDDVAPANAASGGFVIEGDGALTATDKEQRYVNREDSGIHCDRTFIEAVISGDPSKIRSPYSDAVKSLFFTMACNKSMDTGLPVKVELE